MRNRIAPKEVAAEISGKPRLVDSWAKGRLHRILNDLEHGSLTITEGEAVSHFGDPDAPPHLQGQINIQTPRFYGAAVLGGSIGAAEAYMAGWWTANDPAVIVQILTLNMKSVLKMESGLAWLNLPIQWMYHLLRPNTLQGSRRNIAAHYDLGNAFYRLFLDETLTYSSGIFETPDMTLAEASIAKYDRLCQKLEIRARDHILEIGTGWGGFAIHAAKTYGCRVTTTTISREQYELARERVHDAGLSEQVTILFEDFRRLTGTYDKLVSIEMIEAIGHTNIPIYFQTIDKLLKPDGLAGIQAIVMSDSHYARHRRSMDFIKQYIFPGSCLPSISEMCRAVGNRTDMRLFDLEDITLHYCRTLREWRDRFLSQKEKVRELGFSEAFIRMWEFYLAYCEGGFAAGYIGNVQMIFRKPFSRRGPIHFPHPVFPQ